MNKNILYRSVLIFLVTLVLVCDYHILFATIFSLLVIDFSKSFIFFLHSKYKISLKLIGVVYVIVLTCIIILIFKILIDSFINQNTRLIEIINNKNFVNEKIESLRSFFENITEKILLMRTNVDSDLYNKKIDQLISGLPDIIVSKSIMYLKLIVEKSYVSGLKFIDFWYTFLLSMVFLFYFISDIYKIKDFFLVLFGDFNEKLLSLVIYIKNIICIVIINQLKVALILTFLYSIIFYFVNFEYFIIYSLCFSLFSLIPIFGSILSIIFLSISCYIFDYSVAYSLKLLGILFCGFLLENLILTPKIVGKSINTHPLMVLVGVIILPQFFGIFGLIFTLPIVAILNDIILHIMKRIKNNEKYLNG